MVDYEIENIDPGMDKAIVDLELSMHHTPEDYHWNVSHDRETAHRIARFLSAQDIAAVDPAPLQSARAAGVEDAKRCDAATPGLIKGMQWYAARPITRHARRPIGQITATNARRCRCAVI
jgi:hypothetical protein